MKTFSHSLLFIALAASGSALAQDPHAGHAGHATEAKPAVDPHAGHNMPKAKPADPHAAHRGHGGKAKAADPHAGHAMPKAEDHSSHGVAADPHAGHAMPADPHAGHAMPKAEDHSGHGAAADPHAGHAMPADPHAGHNMRGGSASNTPREPIPTPTKQDFDDAFPVLKPHAMEHAPSFNSLVVFDHLEAWDNAHGSGQAWGIDSWFGNDINRLWIRSEGERSDNALGDWSVDALYGHSISPWWDVVAGARHDNSRESPDLTRAAFGLQGMSPYKFEVSAMAYIGGPRKAELAFEVEYDVLLTNRLILQPVVEASIVADDDPRRGVGKGLSSVEAGLRLRYEFTRKFAPYVGFVHERAFGDTADLHRDAGEGVSESRWVAGVRFWF
ncbi:copper resistance protein B [Stenotrophomonas sp.]|uniref:copper resistance protein B n=1 Tax=Stenotrophomonas sp. TaxID=69392 RepID=UPI0028A9645D|nr:copper resistance protein B [Stenotrophomonas sp.]